MFASSCFPVCCDCFFFFQAEDGIRDYKVTGVQTCALPISDCSNNCIAGARQYTGIRVHRRSEEHTSELQSPCNLVCRLLLEKKKYTHTRHICDVARAAAEGRLSIMRCH